MLTLTPNAQDAIRALVDADPTNQAGIRIAVAGPPSDGSAPQLGLEVTTLPDEGDQVLDADGARVFLDATAAALLDQETLDVEVDREQREVNFYLAERRPGG